MPEASLPSTAYFSWSARREANSSRSFNARAIALNRSNRRSNSREIRWRFDSGIGSAHPARTRSTYPLSTLRGLSIRRRAKEPKMAKPSARPALTATKVSTTCLAHAKQLGNVDLRQNASDRIAFLAKRASEPRPAGCCVDVESILGREAPLNVRGDERSAPGISTGPTPQAPSRSGAQRLRSEP